MLPAKKKKKLFSNRCLYGFFYLSVSKEFKLGIMDNFLETGLVNQTKNYITGTSKY